MAHNDRQQWKIDLDALLHPASAFEHPCDVVRDADLTLNEKRAILASWASDACSVDCALPNCGGANGQPVAFEEVMDALRVLDDEAAKIQARPENPFKRRLRHWKHNRRSREGSGGVSLH